MKLTLTREILQAIEALPKDVRLDVYSVIFNYVFNGYILEKLSPTAEAVFLLIKPVLDKQKGKTSTPSEADSKDKTDENIEKIFDETSKNSTPERIVSAAANQGIRVNDVRSFLDFIRRKGVLSKFRHEELLHWQAYVVDAVTTFIRDKLKKPAV